MQLPDHIPTDLELSIAWHSRRAFLRARLGRLGIANVVGPTLGADGSSGPATGRQGKTGETTVALAHGAYYEAASRGACYVACAQAGVAPGTALGTTAFLALYNPIGSKYRLAIQKVSVGYVSGTIGAGVLMHCANVLSAGGTTPAVPSGGTLLTSQNCNIGNQSAPTAQGVARTGGTVTTPVAIRPFASLTAILATTAVGLYQVIEDVAGEFVIEPGQCYQMQAIAAAGSTPLLAPGISWQEIPISGTNG